MGNLIISLRAVRLDEVSGGWWLLKTLSRDRDGIRQKKQQIQNSTALPAAPADKPWGVHQVLTHGTGEGTAAYATFLVPHASDIIDAWQGTQVMSDHQTCRRRSGLKCSYICVLFKRFLPEITLLPIVVYVID